MNTNRIFNNYTVARSNDPLRPDYYVPHSRNLEGFENHFLRLLPQDKNVRILDVGCGWGQFLYLLRQKGYNNIEGIDLGHNQIEITKKLGIKAEQISDLYEYLSNRKESWDIIIASQAIEHFPKNKMLLYLEGLRSALKKNGKIIIGTPNMALMSGAIQRYTDFTHETGLTERSLEQILHVSGFSNIEIYGEKLIFRPRLKFLVWFLLRNMWFKILGFIYLLENGVDRPRILSRHLIAVADK